MQEAALKDRSRQLLDKQRDTVGASSDMRDELVGESLARHHLVQYGTFVGVQAVEQQRAHMRRSAPGLREFGTKGDDQQDRQPADQLGLLLAIAGTLTGMSGDAPPQMTETSLSE